MNARDKIPKAKSFKREQRSHGGYEMVPVYTLEEVAQIVSDVGSMPEPCCGNFVDCHRVCMPRATALERKRCIALCQDEVNAFKRMGNDGYRYGARSCMESLIATAEYGTTCCEHDSDCAVHNGPALPVGPCNCSQRK